MSIPLSCRCGQVQGQVGTDHTYTRATCYCTDCRAYAQWLGVPGLLDDAGERLKHYMNVLRRELERGGTAPAPESPAAGMCPAGTSCGCGK